MIRNVFSIPMYSFYCSFTPALFCDCAKRHKTSLVLLSAGVFVSKFANPALAHRREQDITMVAETEQKGGKKYRSTRRGRGPGWWQGRGRGWCIFSENTARTSSRHRRPREEWKNNILPFRPRVARVRSFIALFPLLFIITYSLM